MDVQEIAHQFFSFGLIYSVLFCIIRTIIDIYRWFSPKGKSSNLHTDAAADSAEAFGERAERRVEQELRDLDVPTLRNVFLQDPKGRLTEIDLLALVGSRILVVEVKAWPGQIVADPSAKEWLQIKERGDRKTMANPLEQNRRHQRVLQTLLPTSASEGLVVFAAGTFEDGVPPGVVDVPALLTIVTQTRQAEPDDATLLAWGKLASWSTRQNKSELNQALIAQITGRREQVAVDGAM